MDGFYRTGDIVERDERGYLTVLGRSKDQINRGGEKIAPEEVENLILGHEGVHDVSVVGVPDRIIGERIKAYLIPRQGVDPVTLRLPTIRQFLRECGLAAYKLPDALEIVGEFPHTAIGKVSKLAQRGE
ncbi:AMP-binding enzyme [Parafrankia elaeagni]|uniref:AMP-binding enzyme n=1 Tax=Parafrankia elaeagni TaxID=222534 RepID=UPI0038993AE8